jgi:hypothetical protein
LTRRRRQLLIAVFALGFVTAHGDPTLGQTTPGETAREAIPNAISGERFWLAGRYDRTRVVLYFEPSIKEVQAFSVAGGGRRYYVRAELRATALCTTIGAWLAPALTLHIVAAQVSGCLDDFLIDAPRLLNVVDLGGGRTGIILSFTGGDGSSLELFDYRDGIDVTDMRSLPSISHGE